jgi:hypothetical protein
MSRASLATASVLLVALTACEGSTSVLEPDLDGYVVQAFLFAGEPVQDVTVTGLLPIGADTTEVPDPISDASISLFRGDERFDLIATAGEPGRYHYPDVDLTVATGDAFRLEITANGRSASAATVVPSPPEGLELSADSLVAPDFGSGPGGGFFPDFATLAARWANPAGELHFLVIDNVEPDPEILPTTEIFTRFAPRFITTPTPADSSIVTALSLTHYGLHRVRLYRVNDEYVDLYDGLLQDSRDLNEPPSNVRGALGIFSAFAADSAFFNVR